MSFEYSTRDGEAVYIPETMDPYKQLGIPYEASPAKTKSAVFREMMKPKRQDRARASLAYHMITSIGNQYQKTSTIFEIKTPDIFFFAAIGHKKKVIAEIEKDPSLVKSADEYQRTALYIAARCGFSDIIEILIQRGADVNHKQLDNSTPLHVAAYYGQKGIVNLLLVHGADPHLKNNLGHDPVSEAFDDVKEVFEAYKKDPFQSTVTFFASTNLSQRSRPILFEDTNVGVEVFRSISTLDPITKNEWDKIKHDWEVAYHGTKQKHINSILTHGLIPTGTKVPFGETVMPPSGHIPVETFYAEKKNWSKAVFATPSIMYASHPCYSENMKSGDSQWCIVVKVLVKPKSYDAHYPTTAMFEKPIEGEPDHLEYRVKPSDELDILGDCMIKDVEVIRNAVVVSIMFIDLSFLASVRDCNLSHDDLQRCFARID